jgi:hypothetical protein
MVAGGADLPLGLVRERNNIKEIAFAVVGFFWKCTIVSFTL